MIPLIIKSIIRTTLIISIIFISACQDETDQEENDQITTIEGFGFHIEKPASPLIVPTTLAGANYLATRDLLAGTFGPRAESLDITLLRWPGGTLTEEWEDFLNAYIIDADIRNWDHFENNAPWSLQNFLSWTSERDIVPTMVLPTKRYINQDGSIDHDRAGRELGAFVREVTSGRFGDHPVEIWEIGNEFMWGDFKISEETYAELASTLIPVLRDAAQYPIKLGVQAGRLGDGRIPRVAAGFTAQERDDVDFLIDHIYARNYDWDYYLSRFQMYRNNWGEKPIYISEWNIKATQGANLDTYSYGIEQVGPILRIWDSMVGNNVQYGAFWAIQQNNWTSAYPREGEYPDVDLYYGGSILDWMTDTVGHERLQTTQIGDDGMYAASYFDNSNLTIFVAGLEAGTQQVKLLLPDFNIQSVNAIRMTGERDKRRSHPTYFGLNPLISDGQVTFSINTNTDQEIVKIEISGNWSE
jgi:hypothetical protein